MLLMNRPFYLFCFKPISLIFKISCLIFLARTSYSMSAGNGKNEQPCLISSLKGKTFTVSSLNTWLQTFSYRLVCVCVCVLVAQLCPTLCNPMGYRLLGSSVNRILQARILEWIAISFSRGSSQPRDQTWVSCIAGIFQTFKCTVYWIQEVVSNFQFYHKQI